MLYVFLYLVFHQCVFDQEKKGNRNICVYGIIQSKNRKAICHRDSFDRCISADIRDIFRCAHSRPVSNDFVCPFGYSGGNQFSVSHKTGFHHVRSLSGCVLHFCVKRIYKYCEKQCAQHAFGNKTKRICETKCGDSFRKGIGRNGGAGDGILFGSPGKRKWRKYHGKSFSGSSFCGDRSLFAFWRPDSFCFPGACKE